MAFLFEEESSVLCSICDKGEEVINPYKNMYTHIRTVCSSLLATHTDAPELNRVCVLGVSFCCDVGLRAKCDGVDDWL